MNHEAIQQQTQSADRVIGRYALQRSFLDGSRPTESLGPIPQEVLRMTLIADKIFDEPESEQFEEIVNYGNDSARSRSVNIQGIGNLSFSYLRTENQTDTLFMLSARYQSLDNYAHESNDIDINELVYVTGDFVAAATLDDAKSNSRKYLRGEAETMEALGLAIFGKTDEYVQELVKRATEMAKAARADNNLQLIKDSLPWHQIVKIPGLSKWDEFISFSAKEVRLPLWQFKIGEDGGEFIPEAKELLEAFPFRQDQASLNKWLNEPRGELGGLSGAQALQEDKGKEVIVLALGIGAAGR